MPSLKIKQNFIMGSDEVSRVRTIRVESFENMFLINLMLSVRLVDKPATSVLALLVVLSNLSPSLLDFVQTLFVIFTTKGKIFAAELYICSRVRGQKNAPAINAGVSAKLFYISFLSPCRPEYGAELC
jgi:hypothetical protein